MDSAPVTPVPIDGTLTVKEVTHVEATGGSSLPVRDKTGITVHLARPQSARAGASTAVPTVARTVMAITDTGIGNQNAGRVFTVRTRIPLWA